MVTGGIRGDAAERAGGEDTPDGDPAGSTAAPAPEVPRLDRTERGELDIVRRLGTVGSLLLAVGSLGAGAAPVYNPLPTVPVVGLFARIPSAALAGSLLGMGMIVVSWLLLGRYAKPGGPRLITKAQLDRTLVMWMVPLLLIPPLFSRDVYSYLAQSAIVSAGQDPYEVGPAQALGVADPLTRGVPNIWRETPAPYGPLFLTLGHWMYSATGNHVVTGVLMQRLLALIGVALFVWALPRLARRFGVQPVTALWLGAANPLVLFHLVAGIHNEALAIGLMMAGLEIGMRRLPEAVPDGPPPPGQPREWTYVLLGVVIITLGAGVKIPALVAAGFLGVMVARRWGGGFGTLIRVGALFLAVAAATMTALSLATGLGFGWIGALGTPNVVRSWISPVTELANLGGMLGIVLGLGNHTDAVFQLVTLLGYAAGALITVKLLLDSFQGRRGVMTGLGASLAAMLLLHPAMHAWYLLFPVIPLAASLAGTQRFRRPATLGIAIFACLVPPTGSTFVGRTYVLPQAWVAAIIVLVLVLIVVNRRLPLLPRRPVPAP